MKEFLTEFDELQEAMKKINLNESTMPYVNGRLVDDDAYNKVQKILNSDEMINAHKFCYDLDLDQLSEDEKQKIDELYKLGCDRGFIVDDLTKNDDSEASEEFIDKTEKIDNAPVFTQNSSFKAKIPCWTIVYSAMKNGSIHTGEAYSNSISVQAAKSDVYAKLSKIGYENISILAIEASDEDNRCNCASEVSEDDEKEDSKPKDDSAKDSKDDIDSEEKSDDTDTEDSENNDDTSDDTEDSDTEDSENNDDTEDSDTEDSEDTDDTEDSEEKSDDAEDADNSDDKEDSDDEDKSDDDSDEKSDDLSDKEKSDLKKEYKIAFTNSLVKGKFEKCFDDMTLEEKVKFFTDLSKAWKKNDPQDFMTSKEIEQLNKVVPPEE